MQISTMEELQWATQVQWTLIMTHLIMQIRRVHVWVVYVELVLSQEKRITFPEPILIKTPQLQTTNRTCPNKIQVTQTS